MPRPARVVMTISTFFGATGRTALTDTPSPGVVLLLPRLAPPPGVPPGPGITAGRIMRSRQNRPKRPSSKWPQPGSIATLPIRSGAASMEVLLAKVLQGARPVTVRSTAQLLPAAPGFPEDEPCRPQMMKPPGAVPAVVVSAFSAAKAR